MDYQNSFGKFIDGGRGFAATTPLNPNSPVEVNGATFDVVIGL